MKKLLVLIMAMVLTVSPVMAQTYVGNSVYCEAGYENDVYNGVAQVLTLNEDGTFELIDNTSIIHNSYAVVTNWFYIVTGDYEVTSEEEGTKEVTLHGTKVVYVMNGSVTTSEEDEELLEDYEELLAECDDDALSLIIE